MQKGIRVNTPTPPETPAMMESAIPGFPVRRGKVRDVYDLGDALLIVATDRISAFDVIMPTPIPGKGRILTALSNFWFRRISAIARHHLIATECGDFPAGLLPFAPQLTGRSILAKKAEVIPVECIVRGYIAGGGWNEYQRTGAVCGVKLPAGLQMCEKLPSPVFTPTTKAAAGHDESITFAVAADIAGRQRMELIRDRSIRIYQMAAEFAASRGIIIADTKFEWGMLPGDADPILIDEVLTPDSSRFWPADSYRPGRDQSSYDKQYLRNYLQTLNWNKQPPGPALPPEIVADTLRKYQEALRQLTGGIPG